MNLLIEPEDLTPKRLKLSFSPSKLANCDDPKLMYQSSPVNAPPPLPPPAAAALMEPKTPDSNRQSSPNRITSPFNTKTMPKPIPCQTENSILIDDEDNDDGDVEGDHVEDNDDSLECLKRKSAESPLFKQTNPLSIQTSDLELDYLGGESDISGGKLTLWQFLLELLLSDKYKHIIRWTNRHGEFILLQAEIVAKLWGLRKDKNHRMNYDKLSRALRYYYQKNIIRKVHGRKFVYQFINLENLIKFCQTNLSNGSPNSGGGGGGLVVGLDQVEVDKFDQELSPPNEKQHHQQQQPNRSPNPRTSEEHDRLYGTPTYIEQDSRQFNKSRSLLSFHQKQQQQQQQRREPDNDLSDMEPDDLDIKPSLASMKIPECCELSSNPNDSSSSRLVDTIPLGFTTPDLVTNYSFNNRDGTTGLQNPPSSLPDPNRPGSNFDPSAELLSSKLTSLLSSWATKASLGHWLAMHNSILSRSANQIPESTSTIPSFSYHPSRTVKGFDENVQLPKSRTNIPTSVYTQRGLIPSQTVEPILKPARQSPSDRRVTQLHPDRFHQNANLQTGFCEPGRFLANDLTEVPEVFPGPRDPGSVLKKLCQVWTRQSQPNKRSRSPNCSCSCHSTDLKSLDPTTYDRPYQQSPNHSLSDSSSLHDNQSVGFVTMSSPSSDPYRVSNDDSPVRLHHERHAINMQRLEEQLSRFNRIQTMAHSTEPGLHPMPNGPTDSRIPSHPHFGPTQQTPLNFSSMFNLDAHMDNRRSTLPSSDSVSSSLGNLVSNSRDSAENPIDSSQPGGPCVWMPVPVSMLTSWFELLSSLTHSTGTFHDLGPGSQSHK